MSPDVGLEFLRRRHDEERAAGVCALSWEACCRASGILAATNHGWDDPGSRPGHPRPRLLLLSELYTNSAPGAGRPLGGTAMVEPRLYPIVPTDDRPPRKRRRRRKNNETRP